MGCGEDFLLAGTKLQAEQGLREGGGVLGGIYLCGDDTAYGEASASCLRIIRQFLKKLSDKSLEGSRRFGLAVLKVAKWGASGSVLTTRRSPYWAVPELSDSFSR